jgi:hypothetical protein
MLASVENAFVTSRGPFCGLVVMRSVPWAFSRSFASLEVADKLSVARPPHNMAAGKSDGRIDGYFGVDIFAKASAQDTFRPDESLSDNIRVGSPSMELSKNIIGPCLHAPPVVRVWETKVFDQVEVLLRHPGAQSAGSGGPHRAVELGGKEDTPIRT